MQKEKLLFPKISVGGFITRCQGANLEILLVQKSYGPMKGKLTFPGGFVDRGENLEKALRREILEETGIEIRKQKLIGIRLMINSKENSIYFIFRAEAKNRKEPRVSPESESVEYYDLKIIKGRENLSSLVKYIVKNIKENKLIEKTNFIPREIKVNKNNYFLYLTGVKSRLP